jgi:hypothetical protein
MDDQLQQIIELHKEQNQLLKRYLWRLRFSLLGLLLLMTISCVGLGMIVYKLRQPAPKIPGSTPPPPRITLSPDRY